MSPSSSSDPVQEFFSIGEVCELTGLKPHVVLAHLDQIERAIEKGSVITVDNGIQVLACAASRDEKYSREILPYVLEHLRTCRAQSLPQYAEKSLIAINAGKDGSVIVEEVKKVKDGEEAASIRKAVDALSQAVQKVGAAVYQQTPPPQPEAGPADTGTDPNPNPDQPGPDVVEGESKEQ